MHRFAYSVFCCTFLFIFSSVSFSAEIKFDKGFYNSIIIEGVIEQGDYKKFKNFIYDVGADINRVVIASSGGNVLESIEIGNLIRELKLTTSAATNSDSLCKNLGISRQNCTCKSACFLIYAGGIKRSGQDIGVHRGFLSDGFETLKLDKAVDVSLNINKTINKYLLSMGIPSTLIEDVMYTPSSEIYWLPKEQIKKFLSGYIPEVKNWFSAKCKDDYDYLYETLEKDNDLRSIATYSYFSCLKDVQGKETFSSFKKFTKKEFRECKDIEGELDLRKLLGLDYRKVVSEFKCRGIPTDFLKKKYVITKNNDSKYEVVPPLNKFYISKKEGIELSVLSGKVMSIDVDFLNFKYKVFKDIGRGDTYKKISKIFGKPNLVYKKRYLAVPLKNPIIVYYKGGFVYEFTIFSRSTSVIAVSVYKRW